MRTKNRAVACLTLLVLLLGSCAAVPCTVSSQGGGPTVANLRANAETVGRYEKFELTFDITDTVATDPYFPYDPDPPAGVPAGVGVSVDGLFSNDDWATSVAQPAFLYQGFEHDCIGAGENEFCQYSDGQEYHSGREWLYPVGDPMWKIRFAPHKIGVWRYRIRVTDASGTTYYPADGDLSFIALPSDDPDNHVVNPCAQTA